MLVDGRQRGQAKSPADFFEARGITLLLNEVPKVVQNLSLTLGKWLHLSLRGKWAKLGCDYTQRKGENPL